MSNHAARNASTAVLPPQHRLPAIVAALALVPGFVATATFARAGLTLSHYDARGHLVVARRIIDSLTPGWVQIGAVWLPLPHLLNLVPVQIDLFYRTGASAIAISTAAFALAAYATTRLVLHLTGCRLSAVAGALVVALNPNVLYLQATPMTEPLLIGLTVLSVALVVEWLDAPTPGRCRAAGWVIVAACLTRYEAWLTTAALLALALAAQWWRHRSLAPAIRELSALAVYPALTVGVFLLHSRVAIGEWFVTGGFFRPDNELDLGRPLRAMTSVWWGAHVVTTHPLLIAAVAGIAAMLSVAVARRRPVLLVPLALAACGLLPWYAFVSGHPFRIRYMVALVPAIAVWASTGAGVLAGRARTISAAAVALLALAAYRPFDLTAPMVVEAQLDRDNRAGRETVTACLAAEYRGETIMASMGSLAHYMHELSSVGLPLREFLHEGNGEIWRSALNDPWPHVGWILIEERAEGGDMLAVIVRSDPQFLVGFTRRCEGGGVALYRRQADRPAATLTANPDGSAAR